ncbi:MAG: NYN domain-containing protein [Bilifractor sp.]
MENELKFAVLIDADNVSEKYIRIILEETSNNGIATYKRIYGDWTSPRMNSWKQVLLNNSIIPIQQYSYTTGKNSTDSAMIIDAMDILYSNTVDGFVIVSSDSDFTRLVARLREAGKQVIGMGETKTPMPFITACNQFKYLDMLYEQKLQEAAAGGEGDAEEENVPAAEEENVSSTGKTVSEHKTVRTILKKKPDKRGTTREERELEKKRQKDLSRVRNALNTIIEKFSDEDNWIFSGKLGDQLSRRMPEFDVRNFGYNKFTAFIKSLGSYEWEERKDVNGQKQIYFRIRKKQNGRDTDR